MKKIKELAAKAGTMIMWSIMIYIGIGLVFGYAITLVGVINHVTGWGVVGLIFAPVGMILGFGDYVVWTVGLFS